MILIIPALIFGYLLGSVPTAWLVGRYALGKGTDVRTLGDGNVGATNIGQLLGPRWGTFVGAADIFKGFAAVAAVDAALDLLISENYPGPVSTPGMAAGVACVFGHIWPVWLGFRGGRGAAAAIGVAGAVFTTPVLLLTAPVALILLVTRNTSLAFCLIYYGALVVAREIFDVGWEPIIYCWLLALPVLLTDPRLRRWWRRRISRKSASA